MTEQTALAGRIREYLAEIEKELLAFAQFLESVE